MRLLAASLFAFLLGFVHAQDAVGDLRYGRDVRPILADRCFRCHGPDATKREAKLRLDDRDAAVAARDGGAAIVPGDPDASQLWQRVRSHDDADRMPPPASGKPPLTAAELATIEAWLRGGAPYEEHWAFVPPRPVAVPAGEAPHAIDRFLQRTRAAHRLPANPPADRTTLARRLYLVLTGLPPTAAEVAAFVADPDPQAYERLVDRLLGSEPYRTRHAEHLAGMWLDAGRYADTSGIHMDAGRQAWAWRDWLLRALRDDMPFDRFVVEQLAGDLLPDATPDTRVATGFLRNHVTTDEGGAIDEEYRVEYAAERTATVGSVFLGLTLACARCHDHKYDPIRQEDFYRLFAFFNSNQEPGLYSQVPDANRALEPFLEIPTAEQQQRLAELTTAVAEAERRVAEPSPEEAAAFADFRRDLDLGARLQWSRPRALDATSTHGSTVTIAADGCVEVAGENPAQDEHVVRLQTEHGGLRWLAIEALPDARLPAGKVGRAPNGNAVLQHVRLEWRPNPTGTAADPAWQPVPWLWACADVEQRDGDYSVTNLLADDRRGWAVAAHQAEPRPVRAALLTGLPFGASGGAELRVTLRYDSVYAQHVLGRVRLYVGSGSDDALLDQLPLAGSGLHLAGPFPATGPDAYATRHGPESGPVEHGRAFGETKVKWRFDANLELDTAYDNLPQGRNTTFVGQRLFAPRARRVTVQLGSDDGFQLFANGAMVAERRVDRAVARAQDEATFDLPAGPSTLVLAVVNTGGQGGFALHHVPAAGSLPGDLRLLLLPDVDAEPALLQRAATTFRATHSPHHKQLVAARTKLQQQLDELRAAVPRAMVMQESQEARPTFVLTRGEYDKPDPQRPVARELPAMFGALPVDAPKNRLGLARWLVSEPNPLLLRVQMNRLWEFVFGNGLVRTSEDFGRQGEWPSHPELLDWLAVEFRARGLSVRAMLRLLVTSDAFRQASRTTKELLAADRDNRMLAWFPRRRLTAEAIRDQALFVSGLLVEQSFGPSVKPQQPAGLWQEVAMVQSNTRVYVPGQGDDLRRRSLYTYWKRACPPPNLLVLDAPTREFCTIRRTTTNTPLQALVLWNDEQFVVAARALAQRFANTADAEERLAHMYAACTGRTPEPKVLAAATQTFTTLRTRYASDAAAAKAVAGDGTAPAADLADLAAMVLVANAFLNLDATLCID